jgi:hypothetical protein
MAALPRAAILLALYGALCVGGKSIYVPLSAFTDPARAHSGFISYVASIGIGTPPTIHTVVVDTGSAALAVSGSQCFDSGVQGPCARTVYDPSAFPSYCLFLSQWVCLLMGDELEMPFDASLPIYLCYVPSL